MNKFYETLTNLRGDVLFGYRAQVVDDTGALVDIFQDRSGTRFTDDSGNIVNYAEAGTDTGMAEFYWNAETGQILQIADSGGDLARPPIVGFGDNFVLNNLSGDLPTTVIDGLDDTLAEKADVTYVDTGLDAKVPTADLASTDPGKGAGMVGYKAPYTDALSRNIGGRFNDLVSVTDFDTVASAATSAFTKAFAAAAEYGRDLYIPKLDAGAKYSIEGSLLVPTGMKLSGGGSGSGATRVDPGALLEFEDGALDLTDGAGLTLENFGIIRVGTASGAAIECVGDTLGFARNVFNNITIIGSNDIGVRMSGGWLFSWFNPYVRECRIGLLIEEGIGATGMNNVSLYGGEFHGNTEAHIVLDRCKQFNLVGTAIEGGYGVGIGIGASVIAASLLGYFEANAGGHIVGYSHNGGTAGQAQAVTVESGSYFLRGTGSTMSPADISAIDIPKCRSFYMQDGVFIHGYAGNTAPMIHVADVGDSNRAVGFIGQITTDAPAALVLDNDCQGFGRETRRHFYLNAVVADDVTSALLKVPVWKGPAIRRNPSNTATVIFHLNVTTGGDLALAVRGVNSAGATVGTQVGSTQAVVAGYNRLSVTVGDSEDVANFAFFRNGASGVDTAVGVTIECVEVVTNENTVKRV